MVIVWFKNWDFKRAAWCAMTSPVFRIARIVITFTLRPIILQIFQFVACNQVIWFNCCCLLNSNVSPVCADSDGAKIPPMLGPMNVSVNASILSLPKTPRVPKWQANITYKFKMIFLIGGIIGCWGYLFLNLLDRGWSSRRIQQKIISNEVAVPIICTQISVSHRFIE